MTSKQATVDLIVDPAVAAKHLVSLHESGIDFALLADGKAGYCWYLPNPDGPEEQEDWVFHALRHGRAGSFPEAVRQLRNAAAELHPHSFSAKGGQL